MDAQTIEDLMNEANNLAAQGVRSDETEVGKRGLLILNEVAKAGIADPDISGDAAGLIVFKTNEGQELPMLVGYLLPVVVPDYLSLKETNSNLTLGNLPQEILEKLKTIIETHNFYLLSIEDLKSYGVDLEEFFSKYVYY